MKGSTRRVLRFVVLVEHHHLGDASMKGSTRRVLRFACGLQEVLGRHASMKGKHQEGAATVVIGTRWAEDDLPQ